jgi:AraC-like DNA-binding protein
MFSRGRAASTTQASRGLANSWKRKGSQLLRYRAIVFLKSSLCGYDTGMLHKDVLIRLCHARDLLRDIEDETLSIRRVARDVGMSTFHFIRLFKAVFGETPKQCQLKARLEKAKYLLMITDASVTDVCMETGFSSLGTFTYVFTRRVGMSPKIYRRKMRGIMTSPSEIPEQLIPGCFSLMRGR